MPIGGGIPEGIFSMKASQLSESTLNIFLVPSWLSSRVSSIIYNDHTLEAKYQLCKDSYIRTESIGPIYTAAHNLQRCQYIDPSTPACSQYMINVYAGYDAEKKKSWITPQVQIVVLMSPSPLFSNLSDHQGSSVSLQWFQMETV